MKKLFFCMIMCLSFAFSVSLDEGLGYYEAQNYSKAYNVFNQLCIDENSPKSCFSLGFMYENAQGLNKDDDKAAFYYEKACKLRLSGACFNLALLYNRYEKFDEARLVFYKACSLGHLSACLNLALYYEDQKDGQMALEFYSRACRLKDASSCYQQALLFEKGEFIRQNLRRAQTLFEQSCRLNYAPSCAKLGEVYEGKKDNHTALRYYARACDLGNVKACASYKALKNQDTQN